MPSSLVLGASSSTVFWDRWRAIHAISRAAVGPENHAGRGFRGRGLRPSLWRPSASQRRAWGPFGHLLEHKSCSSAHALQCLTARCWQIDG